MQTFRASSVVDNHELAVIVVESIESHYSRSSRGCRLLASIKPAAVVVRSAAGAFAFDLQASPVDLDELRQRSSGLDAEIERLTRHESDSGESERWHSDPP